LITEVEIRADERRKCWEEVSALIQSGPLPGNGCDETAQRNGLILAANHLCRDMTATDYDDHLLRRKKPQPNPKPSHD
jgi:hypothetical protein